MYGGPRVTSKTNSSNTNCSHKNQLVQLSKTQNRTLVSKIQNMNLVSQIIHNWTLVSEIQNRTLASKSRIGHQCSKSDIIGTLCPKSEKGRQCPISSQDGRARLSRPNLKSTYSPWVSEDVHLSHITMLKMVPTKPNCSQNLNISHFH